MRIIDILSILVVFQLVFISLFLFTHTKGKRLSHRLLGAFFLSLAFNIGSGLLMLTGAYPQWQQFVFLGSSFGLLLGPLLYLYTKSMIYKDYMIPRNTWLHLLPFLLLLGSSFYFYSQQPEAMQRYVSEVRSRTNTPPIQILFSLFVYGQFFAYLYFSLREIVNYRQAIREQFSAIEHINLSWLTSTIVVFGIAMLLATLNSFIGLTPFKGYHEISLGAIIVALFIFINQVIFKALQQPQVFSGIELTSTEKEGAADKNIPVQRKYATSSLSTPEREAHLQHLLHLMSSEKLYLDPELSIEDLANRLSIPVKTLSQVINESLEQSFFDFVNTYRINEAKLLLSNPADKKITVLEVMYKVGFNSKSSFNTAFKKLTQMTPSDFKKVHMQ
jgi:AraC-like DNA-binding protein